MKIRQIVYTISVCTLVSLTSTRYACVSCPSPLINIDCDYDSTKTGLAAFPGNSSQDYWNEFNSNSGSQIPIKWADGSSVSGATLRFSTANFGIGCDVDPTFNDYF